MVGIQKSQGGVLPRFRQPSPLPNIVNTGRLPTPSFPQQVLHVAHRRASLVPSTVARFSLDDVAHSRTSRTSPIVPGSWFLVSIGVVYPLSTQSPPLFPSYI